MGGLLMLSNSVWSVGYGLELASGTLMHAACQIIVTGYYSDAEYIFLSISDSGVGIAKDHIERIFKGENISSRGTKNEKGTGIGLMICWNFMERNGGKISLKGELGKGSTFSMKIPRLVA